MSETKKSNKGYLIAGAVILILVALALCTVNFGKNRTLNADNTSVSFNLKVTCDGTEVIYDKPITVKSGESLMDIIKENLNAKENDGFITSICDKEQNEEEFRYWMYSINGESAQIGAAEYYPADGDEIIFDLSVLTWE